MFPIAAIAAGFNHFAVIHFHSHCPPVKCFEPLGQRRWNLKTHGDVAGDMIPTHPHAVGINQVFFEENRNARRPATHINTGRTKLLLIFNQSRMRRNIGRGGHARQLNITAFHALVEILYGTLLYSQNMQISRKILPNMTTRVGHPSTIIQCEINRLRMHHSAAFAKIRQITGRQHAANIL